VDLNSRRQLPLFSIGIVQKLTGLTARQIRYYEEHGLVQPVRSEGKQRLFSFVDVERLMAVRSLLDDGHNMAGVKARLLAPQEFGSRTMEPSDAEVYKRLQQEFAVPNSSNRNQTTSMFQGEMSRFYPKKH